MQYFFGVFFRGIAMGAADVVPGVSGGTIAFITGIYATLLQSLSRFDLALIKVFRESGLKGVWQRVNGHFLLALFAGIAVSILSLARIISYLLENHPLLVWSFFFGLILASSIFVLRQMERWHWQQVVLLLLGIGFAVLIGQLRPVEVVADYGYFFMAGAIAICAMILPGISGSFILLLLGVYGQVLVAVKSLDFAVLGVFVSGCVIGLLSFVKLFNFLLSKYYQSMMALLGGFIAGSLYLVWPWKQVISVYTNSHGIEKPLQQINVLPATFTQITGEPSQLLPASLLMLLGLIVVSGLDVFSEKKGGEKA